MLKGDYILYARVIEDHEACMRDRREVLDSISKRNLYGHVLGIPTYICCLYTRFAILMEANFALSYHNQSTARKPQVKSSSNGTA